MKIGFYSSNDEILKELGERAKAQRIAMGFTQKDLAEKTNLSLRTISNLETGKDVAFSTVLEVLRALGNVGAVDALIPEVTIRPSEIVEMGKQRERASHKKDEESKEKEASGWKWGDEQ